MSLVARALATVGGLGDLLPAPGTTVGSTTGAALFWFVVASRPAHAVTVAAAGLVLLAAVGVWACGAEAQRRGGVDPGPVVLDEVAGQWLALTTVLVLRGQPVSPGAVLASFLLFRVFDVVKPWPIRRLERLPGGWGIVADDLAAGLAAGLIQVIALAIF